MRPRVAGDAPVGAVVIGRNEGARLIACLDALAASEVRPARVVYVDSGSTDGSVEAARARGAQVVALDLALPFTAARARNAGLDALRAGGAPPLVQFLDGDCAVDPRWIGVARRFLAERPEAAVACGRRRERHPRASIYNLMCDAEWDTPVGRARSCGGDAMMRTDALGEVGGFDPSLIAGEEPELCVRLRLAGWQIWRLDAEMTLHDAAMTRFAQHWRRMRRAGHARAEGAALHGAPPERHGVRGRNSALLWGVALPASVLAALPLVGPWALGGLAAYPAQVLRLGRRTRGPRPFGRAALLVAGKFAEAQGVLEYHGRALAGRRGAIIEYK